LPRLARNDKVLFSGFGAVRGNDKEGAGKLKIFLIVSGIESKNFDI
jgi:hypothetical protein